VQAALGSSTASWGVGVTVSRSAGFTHGSAGSRDAAPKQRGVADAVAEATKTSTTDRAVA
jgi:hypothetical protein